MKPKFLVTSAVGRTGFAVTMQILENGYPVRGVAPQGPEAMIVNDLIDADLEQHLVKFYRDGPQRQTRREMP